MIDVPPTWVPQAGTRLELREFGNEFASAIARVHKSFVKMEAWQEYQEPGTKSLEAFLQGEIRHSRDLIRAEADEELSVYQELSAKDLALYRTRLIKKPLTQYLQWEMLNYRVRVEPRYGERVGVVDLTTVAQHLPNHRAFDFLLFDDAFALVHDYGADGLQVGGWKVSDETAIRSLRNIAEDWMLKATDIRETEYGLEHYRA